MERDTVCPQISVIIPVFNGEAFIPGIVDCLARQTLKNFEVVFVNDGSADDTGKVLESLRDKQLPFLLTVIHQENRGVSAARNIGLRAAHGDYVCFVDADDTISVDYLEVLYNALQSTGLRVAVASITRDEQELYCGEAMKVREVPSEEFLRQFLYQGIRYSVCACMFDKCCFTERQLCFPEGYRYSEDVFVLWQIFAAEKAIAETQRKLYYYFDNPYSAMNKGIDVRRLDAIHLMQQLEPIIAQLNPEFSPEFNRYAVARHHWSILWQAATMLDSYEKFREYCSNFEMKAELKKLLDYPERRISLSSACYLVSPLLYYHLLRAFVSIKNRRNEVGK